MAAVRSWRHPDRRELGKKHEYCSLFKVAYGATLHCLSLSLRPGELTLELQSRHVSDSCSRRPTVAKQKATCAVGKGGVPRTSNERENKQKIKASDPPYNGARSRSRLSRQFKNAKQKSRRWSTGLDKQSKQPKTQKQPQGRFKLRVPPPAQKDGSKIAVLAMTTVLVDRKQTKFDGSGSR